jgi:hypothetical protein
MGQAMQAKDAVTAANVSATQSMQAAEDELLALNLPAEQAATLLPSPE